MDQIKIGKFSFNKYVKRESLINISYIKPLLIQTYADLNLEYVDISSSDSLDKFNKKYHKRNMND